MRAQQPKRNPKQESGFLPERPKPPRNLSGAYTASWAFLGCLSAAYIAVLVLQPEWATPITTQSLPAKEPPPVPPLVQQLTDEIGSLRKTVSELQRELDEVKSTAVTPQEPQVPLRGSNQETELAVLDPDARSAPPQIDAGSSESSTSDLKLINRPALVAAAKLVHSDKMPVKTGEPESRQQRESAGPAPIPAVVSQDKAGQRAQEPAAANRKQRDEVAKPERNPMKKVVVLNANPVENTKRAAPLETGSLPPSEPPLITFGPPIVTPAVGIHLDAAPSLDALRLKWSVLHERHRSALGELQPRFIVTGSGESPSYLLMAGPISTPDEASRICALLRMRSVPCSVGGPFTGEAL